MFRTTKDSNRDANQHLKHIDQPQAYSTTYSQSHRRNLGLSQPQLLQAQSQHQHQRQPQVLGRVSAKLPSPSYQAFIQKVQAITMHIWFPGLQDMLDVLEEGTHDAKYPDEHPEMQPITRRLLLDIPANDVLGGPWIKARWFPGSQTSTTGAFPEARDRVQSCTRQQAGLSFSDGPAMDEGAQEPTGQLDCASSISIKRDSRLKIHISYLRGEDSED